MGYQAWYCAGAACVAEGLSHLGFNERHLRGTCKTS